MSYHDMSRAAQHVDTEKCQEICQQCAFESMNKGLSMQRKVDCFYLLWRMVYYIKTSHKALLTPSFNMCISLCVLTLVCLVLKETILRGEEKKYNLTSLVWFCNHRNHRHRLWSATKDSSALTITNDVSLSMLFRQSRVLSIRKKSTLEICTTVFSIWER